MADNVTDSQLPPEVEQGNVEYKLQLINTPPERLEHLITQLKWRLAEGYGEAMYEIGVADKGALVGLTQSELDASVETLKKMGHALSADVSIIRERVVSAENEMPERKVAEVLVRKCLTDDQHFLEIRVAVIGGADAGKSTLLGVLTHSDTDNGRGKSRLNLLRHRHEIESGRTSSISHQIIGFDPHGELINYATSNHTIHTWAQICEAASKVITFLDMCGHPKYQKTTLSGLTGHAPDYACLIVGANAAGVPTVSREHLGIAVSLKVPVFVVITKIDIASPAQLTHTVGALLTLLKSPGIKRVPLVIQNKDDVVVSASSFVHEKIIPVFLTSSVTGANMDLLTQFFNLLPKYQHAEYERLVEEDVEYQIEEVYSVPGAGCVVGGKLLSGLVSLTRNHQHHRPPHADTSTPTSPSTSSLGTTSHPNTSILGPAHSSILYIGPDHGRFAPCIITSIHRHRCPVNMVKAGQVASFAIQFVHRDGLTAPTSSDIPPPSSTTPPPPSGVFRLRKGQSILPYIPRTTRSFTAELTVLHSPDPEPLASNTRAVVYCGSVRQAVRVVDVLDAGISPVPLQQQQQQKDPTTHLIHFRFLFEPEYVVVGRHVVVRGEGGLKCVGKVVDVGVGQEHGAAPALAVR
ncbi:GTP-binding protein 2-like protein [Fimicolochytrium jonesii]|uniref:GTP-binding protein 2-like protein n=1 Tax=Fimicolochytrium jonesii TaxID=1396493 RepID=UPI0022FEBEC4|nr:GTP-binding protein 2-like protein [Fimicolochytrium jonesii]KAI8818768.1 GTP-binding protein 2-like protein [Fimicolochytrium jonesii]